MQISHYLCRCEISFRKKRRLHGRSNAVGCMFRLFEHSDTRHIVRSIPVDRIANLYFDGFIVHVLLLVFASRSFFEERSDVFCFIITFLSDVRIRNLSAFPVILQGPFGYAESLTYVAAVYPFGRGRRTQLLLQPHYLSAIRSVWAANSVHAFSSINK